MAKNGVDSVEGNQFSLHYLLIIGDIHWMSTGVNIHSLNRSN